MLVLMAGMLLLALWARLGRCPHLTVTLLARLARMLHGGPVGPDDSFKVLEPLEHLVLDHADPAGQHAAVGPVGPFGTLSPSDCHPVGPADPYVTGGPVVPDDFFSSGTVRAFGSGQC